MAIVKARREKSYLRCGIAGKSKSGKSKTSIILATGLLEYYESHGGIHGNGRICVIDSENYSSLKYAMASDDDIRDDAYDFDVLHLAPPYTPEAYIKAIKEAAKEKYSVLIIDQISHEWDGQGGILSIHAEQCNENPKANSFALWKQLSKRHDAFVEEWLAYPGHLICTMRSKVKHRFDKETKQVEKIGTRHIQRQDIIYDYDMMGMMDGKHTLHMDESRCPAVDGGKFPRPTKELAHMIAEWLTIGVTTTEVRRLKLDREKAVKLRKLYKQLQYSEDEILENLTERGYSNIEDLPENVADEMIRNIEEYLENEQRKRERENRRREREAKESKKESSDEITMTGHPSLGASVRREAAKTKDLNDQYAKTPGFAELTPEQMREQVGNMLEGDDSPPFETQSEPNPLRSAPPKKTRKKT